MSRRQRAVCAIGVALLLTVMGCQHTLQKDGSYSELENHAMRLDDEFHRLHMDVKEILFGLEPRPTETTWKLYGD